MSASNGSTPEYDPEVVFEDLPEFVDPLIVAPLNGGLLEELGLGVEDDRVRTKVNGIPVHFCEYADPSKVYVVDRPNVVDEDGLCLVCGGETA